MRAIAAAVRRIAERPDIAVIFPVHLNPNVRAVMHGALAGLDNVALIEPLDYPHFARLMAISHLMLTDSGGVQEEAPALGTPVLVMRETTERPEGIAAGSTPSLHSAAAAVSVGAAWSAAIVAMARRLTSSGHGWWMSPLRKPASTCATGILR
jgi:UDP-N-acetylglucosamine 2-epimerase (non-hydrolysing)